VSQRTDTYDDKYGAVVTSRTGEVTVTVDTITVTEPRRAGWDASDEQRALFIALETAKSTENRKDARLAAKHTYWTNERLRLRQRDTRGAR
jgi:hypothetical protein